MKRFGLIALVLSVFVIGMVYGWALAHPMPHRVKLRHPHRPLQRLLNPAVCRCKQRRVKNAATRIHQTKDSIFSKKPGNITQLLNPLQ
ncbi:hypothetical protein [Acinetobacter johnsonii]|uniref:hypothetical protein n=1 Tax=Acinetobacter johnsonii TaxID=40214 RepID=UPI003009E4B2